MGAEEYVVEGLENGGVVLVHEPCDGLAGEGGCDCCNGNAVTLADLINASEQHSCEEEPI
ncbi:hypothetical protein ACIPYS_17980 [Kitasatospora sp. NPDC089913]|uniref:hypothetical protein n=1 Tax=Kitasatospora sp. NPDC089913 TaxID=3364080 RepID=UPI003803A47C